MQPPRRYLPQRALPARAYVPGRTPRPVEGEFDTSGGAQCESTCLPEGRWAEQVEYLWGVDLYNAGYFWEAHEAWEALWRVAKSGSPQREFLQGLIQCAAAALKQSTGKPEAARRLGLRALRHLENVEARRGAACMGVDLTRFASELRRFSETCEDAVAAPTPPLLELHPI